jgi:hypothetical protein
LLHVHYVAVLRGPTHCRPRPRRARSNGLLRSRDLSPFGGLRLDMRPAHAVSIEPGSWAIETELGYQNTWR